MMSREYQCCLRRYWLTHGGEPYGVTCRVYGLRAVSGRMVTVGCEDVNIVTAFNKEIWRRSMFGG